MKCLISREPDSKVRKSNECSLVQRKEEKKKKEENKKKKRSRCGGNQRDANFWVSLRKYDQNQTRTVKLSSQ